MNENRRHPFPTGGISAVELQDAITKTLNVLLKFSFPVSYLAIVKVLETQYTESGATKEDFLEDINKLYDLAKGIECKVRKVV